MNIIGTMVLITTTTFAQSINHEHIKDNLDIFAKSLQSDVVMKINSVEQFKDFSPSFDKNKQNDFNEHVKTYKLEHPIDKVWDTYINANPNSVWAGPRVKLGFIYDRSSDRLHLKSDKQMPKLEVGMVVFNQLDILKLKKLNVAFEITKIDQEKRLLEFSYLNCNLTKGQQSLKFVEDSDSTIIIHTSHFKSDSKLRDKLYPPIHTLLINEHHANMKKELDN